MYSSVVTSLSTLNVFISSQIGVFSKERKELTRRIKERFRWDTFIFEETSRPHSPRELYKAGIQQSQIFIGIYGSEYGWIDKEKGMTISGIHDEWRLATEYKKYRHAFIKNTNNRESNLTELINEIQKDNVTTVEYDTEEDLYNKVVLALDLLKDESLRNRVPCDEVEVPDYLADLEKRYNTKYIINTSYLINILIPGVEHADKIYLYGEQGLGKTVNLLHMSKLYPAIYISLRNRSLSYIITYILHRLEKLLNLNEIQYSNTDEIFLTVEKILGRNRILIILDDVDQNNDVAKYLFGMNAGQSKFIYAGWKNISTNGVVSIKCEGFTLKECDEYISTIAPDINIDTKRDAIEKAKGNPLYLEYFTAMKGQKPAESLAEYHGRMYDALSPGSKEILGIISLCETVLNLEELAIIISDYRRIPITPIRLAEELRDIENHLAISGGMITIFYSAFKEYVNKQVYNMGIAPNIHRNISKIYSNQYDLHFKVFHLVCANEEESVYDDLPNSELSAYRCGYMKIARKLFSCDINMSKIRNDYFRLGYTLYHCSFINKDRNGDIAGLRIALLARKIFEKAGLQEWVHNVDSIIATYEVNLGQGYKAIDTLVNLVKIYNENGMTQHEAVARTNLTYVYQRLGRLVDLQNECNIALELHRKLGDKYGIAGCLINIISCYIAKGEGEYVLSTCRELQKLSKELDSPRLEAAAQNGLTAYYRRKKLYDKAENAANKSILIAKQLNATDLIAINYGNLGNVYRDQRKFKEAKSCYRIGEIIGIKTKSIHNIAHAKGRLAEIAEDEGEGVLSLQLGDESIELWRKAENIYQYAIEKQKKALRIIKFNQIEWRDAAVIHEEVSGILLSIGLHTESYESIATLIGIYLDHMDRYNAARVFQEAISAYTKVNGVEYLTNLLNMLSEWDYKSLGYIDVNVATRELVKCLANNLTKVKIINLVRSTIAMIKRCNNSHEDAVTVLVDGIICLYQRDKCVHYITALAIVFEQVPDDVSGEFLTRNYEKIGALDDSIVYRNEKWLDDQWLLTFSFDKSPMLEIRSGDTKDERIVAVTMLLITFRQKNELEAIVSRYGWKRIGLTLQTLNSRDMQSSNVETPQFNQEWTVVIPEYRKDEYRDCEFTPVIVSENHIKYSDCIRYPNGRNIVGLNLQLINEIIKHFTKNTCPENHLRKIRRKSTTDIFDVKYKAS